jgi:hypothetical protein
VTATNDDHVVMLRHFAKAPSTYKREESTNEAIAKRAREY